MMVMAVAPVLGLEGSDYSTARLLQTGWKMGKPTSEVSNETLPTPHQGLKVLKLSH